MVFFFFCSCGLAHIPFVVFAFWAPVSFSTNVLTPFHGAALSDLEGCSLELVAACLPDYPPSVAVAVLGRWETTFAAAVRKLVDLNCWVHIVDGNSDLDISTQWLLSDTDLALAKQVVDRIGMLDRSRGNGMHRAVQLMKRLREGESPCLSISLRRELQFPEIDIYILS